MIETSRRSLITGFAALLAAPAIVRAQNIMPVKNFNPYFTRYLLDYLIRSDKMIIRVDRALFDLLIPNWSNILTAKQVHPYISKDMIDTMLQPKNKEQKYLTCALTWEEAAKFIPDCMKKYD